MKGIILAGGLGARLKPLTSVLNKHLLPVYDKPMIYYPLEMLAKAGFKEVMMVIGGKSTEELVKLCKDGREFGFERLYYVYQEGEGGIAQALSLTEQYVGNDDCCVVLGDNIMLGDSLGSYAETFRNRDWQRCGAMVLAAKVDDPQNYGVPTFADGRIVTITEKPEKPMSDYGIIGVYFYDRSVFYRIKLCVPSSRGELEITDVNNNYAEAGLLGHAITKGTWIDAGSSIESLTKASWLIGTTQTIVRGWNIKKNKPKVEEEYPELLRKQ